MIVSLVSNYPPLSTRSTPPVCWSSQRECDHLLSLINRETGLVLGEVSTASMFFCNTCGMWNVPRTENVTLTAPYTGRYMCVSIDVHVYKIRYIMFIDKSACHKIEIRAPSTRYDVRTVQY